MENVSEAVLIEKAYCELGELLKIISVKNNFRIFINLLNEGELSVTDLSERLEISQPAVSQHLKSLKLASVVSFERKGKHIYYALNKNQIHDRYGQGIEVLKTMLNV